MQRISFASVELKTTMQAMAEEMPLWTSDRLADKKYISKRNLRKYEEKLQVVHLTPNSTYQVMSDQSSCNDEANTLWGCSDTGMIYLNPQTPKWTLMDKFAGLLSGEECEVGHNQDSSSRDEFTQYMKTNKTHRPRNVYYSDTLQQKGTNCAKVHKKQEIQTDDTASQMLCNVKEINADGQECSLDSGVDLGSIGNDPLIKDVLLFDVCEDSKVRRLFEAMKKRGVQTDAENRPYKCPHCSWAFKKFCNLQSHLETHSGLKPHVCDVCGKAYSHQGTLQQHKRLHTGERPYHCPFCVKTYIWSSDYRKHIRTHTGEKPYVCDTCGKDFVRSSDLRKHERNMHVNDKPFPCTYCDKTFNKPLSLQRHERKHLGERPFCCPDCGKAFALASRMAEHQKTHRGVRPYVCSVCAKCFTKSSNLIEHKAIHSGVRPYKCTECGVSFAMASRLVRHQYVHTGDKPFSCTGCNMSFAQITTLKTHQEQTCAGRIFVCTDCDKSFPCASKLAQHMLSHKDKKV